MVQASTSTTAPGIPYQHADSTDLSETVFGSRWNTGPHDAAQADVYFAGNGYLFGATVNPNFHEDPNYFADTCADCHVLRFPDPSDPRFANATNVDTSGTHSWGTTVNHTFAVDANTCASCHGGGGELATAQGKTANAMAQVLKRMASVLNTANAASTASFQMAGVEVRGKTITQVDVGTTRPMSINVTFSDTSVGTNGLLAVDLTTVTTDGTALMYTGTSPSRKFGNFGKAVYDLELFTNDRSGGVHNLPFVWTALQAADAALAGANPFTGP
jgi:hypothetical protein